jgi:DNA-binding PadR family transcriptional regulator
VIRDPEFSVQTLSVLAALCAEASGWRHGYDIAKETGLKSGTLYPILIRLADRGLVEACWETGQPAGRPRRHLYRLSTEGFARARAVSAGRAGVSARSVAPRRSGRGLEAEGA